MTASDRRYSIRLGLLHAAPSHASLQALLLQGLGLLLFQLLLADLLTLVASGSPLDHLHGVQVAVGGLAVHGLLDNGLGRVGWLALLHLLLLSHMLLQQ